MPFPVKLCLIEVKQDYGMGKLVQPVETRGVLLVYDDGRCVRSPSNILSVGNVIACVTYWRQNDICHYIVLRWYSCMCLILILRYGKGLNLSGERKTGMEFIEGNDIVSLTNPGVVSRQLLWPGNSESERVTMTEVHLEVGACQPRHTHRSSEQIWYALSGSGRLLLADDEEHPFCKGDVVRFVEGDVHGLGNDIKDELSISL